MQSFVTVLTAHDIFYLQVGEMMEIYYWKISQLTRVSTEYSLFRQSEHLKLFSPAATHPPPPCTTQLVNANLL